MHLEHLEHLRLRELEDVLEHVSAGSHILEIGAGSGFQARNLVSRGFSVEAVDLGSSSYAATRVFPVRDYDGKTLPFPDRSFDLVFSSNVLEHIRDLETFLGETHRVLRAGRTAVHVLPTVTWRLWTTLSHYPLLAKRTAQRLAERIRPGGSRKPGSSVGSGTGRFEVHMLIPRRHGEHGSICSEFYLFSRYRWRGVFQRARFHVAREQPGHLFYTGSSLLGDHLSLDTRRRLSWILGSSSRVWVLSRI